MTTENVMLKALQAAKYRLGMSEEQAFCEHKFNPLFASRFSNEVVERRCEKCGLKQKLEMIWVDVKTDVK